MPEEVRYLYPQGVVFLLLGVEVAAVARLGRGRFTRFPDRPRARPRLQPRPAEGRRRQSPGRSPTRLWARTAPTRSPGPCSTRATSPATSRPLRESTWRRPTSMDPWRTAPGRSWPPPTTSGEAPTPHWRGRSGSSCNRVASPHPVAAPTPKIVRSVSGRARPRHGCVRLEPVAPEAGAPPAPLVPIDANPSDRLKLGRRLRGLPPAPTLRVPPLAEVTVAPPWVTRAGAGHQQDRSPRRPILGTAQRAARPATTRTRGDPPPSRERCRSALEGDGGLRPAGDRLRARGERR